MTRTDRPALKALAEHVGILPEYTDALTGRPRPVTAAACEAIVAAMGFDASTERAAETALDSDKRRRNETLLAPVRVESVRRDARPTVEVKLPDALRCAGVEWSAEVVAENDPPVTFDGEINPDAAEGAFLLDLPIALPNGYHQISLTLRTSRRELRADQSFIVAPRRCHTVRHRLQGRRAFGVCANLYTVRTDNDWGIADFTSLAELCGWSAARGMDFVGLNPLHALRNDGHDVSPYGPISRLFGNPIYLDVTVVPELRDCPEARTILDAPRTVAQIERLKSSAEVQYAEIMRLKHSVLRPLFHDFVNRHIRRSTDRARRYEDYCRQRGEALTDFAVFQALCDHFTELGVTADWHDWPAEYQDPCSEAVAAFRRRNRLSVDYHRYLQFLFDEQLSRAAGAAGRGEMGIGLYQDLSLAPSRAGSDVWASAGLFVDRANLGAPPDDYSPTGQDWGLPPINPHRLYENRYRYWIGVLRSGLAHSGALRIDHAMGLLRQYWVPHGLSAVDGAYVRYPAEDLLGILALESRRRKATIIGEDLGTVPPGFSRLLARRGILSCRVLYFQRDGNENFLSPSSYPRRALATAGTHDHVPLAGYGTARDLTLRRESGGFQTDSEFEGAVQARQNDHRALLARLTEEGLLLPDAEPPGYGDFRLAVHRFLARTPSRLVGILLDDLSAETDPVNIPGLSQDQYQSWRRKMRCTLEELEDDSDVRHLLQTVRGELDREYD